MRLRSHWLRGVRGCFICAKDHRANHRRQCDEDTKFFQRLKKMHPKAVITSEYTEFLTSQLHEDNTDDDEEAVAQSAQDIDDSDGSDQVFIAENDLRDVEEMFSNAAFLRSRT